MIRQEINADTGAVILKELTQEEVAKHIEQAEKNYQEALAEIEAKNAAVAAEEAVKTSARAKLAALGLTEEEVAALIK